MTFRVLSGCWQKSKNIMEHEESFYLRSAIGRGAGFVQGLPVSAGRHQLCGLLLVADKSLECRYGV